MDQNALGGGADLTGIDEGAAGDAPGRPFDIGIVEHNGWTVAAKFEHQRLAGAPVGNDCAGFGTAGEGYDVRTWIFRPVHRRRPGLRRKQD